LLNSWFGSVFQSIGSNESLCVVTTVVSRRREDPDADFKINKRFIFKGKTKSAAEPDYQKTLNGEQTKQDCEKITKPLSKQDND